MSLRCRYCGTANAEQALRCGKCQRRMFHGRPVSAPDTYPVVETATAPAYAPVYDEIPRPVRGRLEAVAANPAAPPVEVRKRSRPGQPALFSYRQPGTVVELDPWSGVAAPPTTPVQRKRSGRRRVSEDQRAFDFDAATPIEHLPPVTHSRAPRLMVAPLGLRALAAAFDIAIVLALTALFVLSARLTLGWFPADWQTLLYVAPAPVVIMLGYKLIFALGGQLTLGLQGAQLQLLTVEGRRPRVMARVKRVLAGCLSVASGAMGLLWAICDQEALTWHDHISNTFLTTGETVD